ncbi:MAG: glutamate 5-kinase, partial [Alphaproteobacteria bacterium]
MAGGAVNRELGSAKRMVVKVGSALLADEVKGAIRTPWLDALAEDIAAFRGQGTEVILVSSGAVAVGRGHL